MRIEAVLAMIVRQMRHGAGQWRMPWHGANAIPLNACNGWKYSGINRLILWSVRKERQYTSRYWATFNQWRGLRQSVGNGEKGTALIRPDQGRRTSAAAASQEWRVFHVFNGDQVVNRNESHPDLFGHVPTVVEDADRVVFRAGARIRYGGHRACYVPASDEIRMPERGAFFPTQTGSATQNYYSTLLHELVHWTGHGSREARFQVSGRVSLQEYAFEELVAEIGGAYLCAELGLEVVPRPDHAQYLSSWLQALEGDPSQLVKAAGLASKAATRILSSETPEPGDDDSLPPWFEAQPTQDDMWAPRVLGTP